MRSLRLLLFSLGGFFLVVYVLLVSYLYFEQDEMIFQASKLSLDYKFEYPGDVEELNITANDSIKLSGLLFKAENSKGLVFYLHGNGGCLDSWGDIAPTYTDLGYDIFILDYRGYGKSGGSIENEEQFLNDVKSAYVELLKRYDENKVIIVGYSIGTGSAAMLASINHPKALVLKAPYYSLTQIIDGRVPFMPVFLQKYKFETYKYLEKVTTPIYIFHGTADRVIPYENSVKLMEHISNRAQLITLQGTGHLINGDNPVYAEAIKGVLAK